MIRLQTTVGDIWVHDDTIIRDVFAERAERILAGLEAVELDGMAEMIERGLDFSTSNPEFESFLPETLDSESAHAVHIDALPSILEECERNWTR